MTGLRYASSKKMFATPVTVILSSFCAFCRILFRHAAIMTELVNTDCCCFVVSKWGGGIDW